MVPSARRRLRCACATWRPSLGSAYNGRPSDGSHLATFGARLELAALCGLNHEDLPPRRILLLTGDQRATTLRDPTPSGWSVGLVDGHPPGGLARGGDDLDRGPDRPPA